LLHTEGPLSGVSIVEIAGSWGSDTWTVTVGTGTGEGTIRLDVVDHDTIIDVYYHPLGGVGLGNGDYSTGGVYTIDKTLPTVTITSSVTSPSKLASIPVVVTFSEDIPEPYHLAPNFVEGDISLGNATLSDPSDFERISPRVYQFNVHPSSDGAVTVDLAADMVKDQAGNGNTAAATLAFESDRTPPVPMVTGPGVATNVSPIVFTIDFAEPVTPDLTTDGISVVGGVKGTLSGSGSGPYTLPVTLSADGSVTCEVLEGVVSDGALNLNPASDPVTVRLDSVRPKATVTGPASPTNADPINFVIMFDESVTGLDVAGITVTNGKDPVFSGNGAGPYTMSVHPDLSGPDPDRVTVTCQVNDGAAHDDAGNPCEASNTLAINYNKGLLAVGIGVPSVSLTRNGPVSYTVTYNDADSITLENTGVILNATGTAAAGAVDVTGSGVVERTVTISGITGTGTLGITIKAGTASDAIGNLAEAKGPSETFVVDNEAPVITVNALGITNDATPTLSGTVTDNVAAIASVAVTVDGHTYTAPVTDTWWDVGITNPLAPGVYLTSASATDTVGNSATETMQFTMDPNAWTQVEAVTLVGASPTNAASVDFLVKFSMAVAPVVIPDDFSLHTTGAISGASITGIAGSGKTRTVTVNPGSGDGTIRLDVEDRDTIVDSNSNPLGGPGLGNGDFRLGQAYRMDKTIPHAVITLVSADPTGADVIVFGVKFSELSIPVFDGSKVALTGTLTGVVSVGGVFPNYTVAVILTDPGGDGTVAISVGAGLTDSAGNPYAVTESSVCHVYNWLEPYFTGQPVGVRAYTGDSPTFTVGLNCGANSMHYQWNWEADDKGDVIEVGGNSAVLTLANVTPDNAGAYSCAVTYDGVAHYSNAATLEVAAPLQVTGPFDASAPVGGNCTFSVIATGGYPPLSYAWKKDGGVDTLGTTETLVLGPLEYSDAGTYYVEVTDDNATTVFSNTASLMVTASQVPAVGVIGLGLLAGGLALGGSRLVRRRR
jgi:hypothetical protein